MARLHLFQPHSTFNSTKRSKGCMELVDWTAGLEHWNDLWPPSIKKTKHHN